MFVSVRSMIEAMRKAGIRPAKEWKLTYVYKETAPGVWTVGYYNPQGIWRAESKHTDREHAAERVVWLNRAVKEITE